MAAAGEVITQDADLDDVKGRVNCYQYAYK